MRYDKQTNEHHAADRTDRGRWAIFAASPFHVHLHERPLPGAARLIPWRPGSRQQPLRQPGLAPSPGRKNRLFAGSLRAGQSAAAIMRLVHTARLHGLAPCAYFGGVLERLPTQPASAMRDLLPHRGPPVP